MLLENYTISYTFLDKYQVSSLIFPYPCRWVYSKDLATECIMVSRNEIKRFTSNSSDFSPYYDNESFDFTYEDAYDIRECLSS